MFWQHAGLLQDRLETQGFAETVYSEPAQICLALAGDMHAIYMSIDDSLRRIANQAFFDKLIVTDDDTIHGEPGVPFNVFLDRDA